VPRGLYRSSGGVSIVNAIGSGGYGGAAGLDLWLEARARIEPGVYGGEGSWPGGSARLPEELVRAVAGAAARLSGSEIPGLWIDVESQIPPGRGLKSSAALLTASLGAALEAAGARLPPERLALEAARLSVSLRLSATGALDDHVASVSDAPVVTDNASFRVERFLHSGGCSLAVVIGYGEGVNPIQTLDPAPFRALKRLYRAAAALALEGSWVEAMAVNGLASAAALGVERVALDALAAGAAAAGVTGKGPAFFALVDRGAAKEMAGLLLAHGFTSILVSRFRWCA